MSNSTDFRVSLKNNRIPEIITKMPISVDRVVRKAALDVKARAQSLMREPKHGQVYLKEGGKEHTASAPGEAPAVEIGNLANSLETVHFEIGHAGVTTNSDYAIPLEMGSRKMEARPFLKPALDWVWNSMMDALMQIWEDLK